MIIDVFKSVLVIPSLYVKINDHFLRKIKFLVNKKYRTLRNFNILELKINYGTLKYEFREADFHPLQRILKIIELLSIKKEELIENIKGFRVSGSHRKAEVILPRKIEINENFTEGYALYLAEGDTGFNGKTHPRKLRFTNSDLGVIRCFIQWLNNHFPNLNFYLNIILPIGLTVGRNFIKQICRDLNLNTNQIRIRNDYYNKKIKYRICCDNAILVDLILSLENRIKNICLYNPKLAAAYIRGIMVGEGTAYFNKSRYVRVEMKNEKEIKYLNRLFKLLDFNYKTSLRTERENMWSIYIGAKQLKKFYDEIGFGVHHDRQRILEASVNKVLRVNQYV